MPVRPIDKHLNFIVSGLQFTDLLLFYIEKKKLPINNKFRIIFQSSKSCFCF